MRLSVELDIEDKTMDYNTEKIGHLPLHKEKTTRARDREGDHNLSERVPLAQQNVARIGGECP